MKLGASPSQASSIVKGNIPTYWGEQPGVSGPAYLGASVLFMFLLALFLVRGKVKWWLVSGSILALLLSYGKNLSFLTDFFIEYFPLYNKFRAVTSIQVILELCVPILAILGLKKLFDKSIDEGIKLKALKYAFALLGGLILFFLLFKSTLFDFTSLRDLAYQKSNGSELLKALVEDRKNMFILSLLRTLSIISVCAGIIWLLIKNKFSKNVSLIALAALILFDLVIVNKRYVDADNFVSRREVQVPFRKNVADVEILKDKDHFRVYDLVSGFFSARASYFHNSIGGYNAAQPKLMQDLYDFHISRGNFEVLNMLNVRYFIQPDEDGKPQVAKNPSPNGNSWFVKNILLVNTANEEILTLDSLNTKEVAMINTNDWENYLAELDKINNRNSEKKLWFDMIEGSKVTLISHNPEHLVYESNNEKEGFVVFSENFYRPSWQAIIDGEPVPHLKVDYTLRGLIVPSGEHNIEFKFVPGVIKTGNIITLTSYIILCIVGLIFLYYKRKEIIQFIRNSS